MANSVRFGMVLVVLSCVLPFATGCTVTLPEHGRSLSVGPVANPGTREQPPQPSARDDRPARF